MVSRNSVKEYSERKWADCSSCKKSSTNYSESTKFSVATTVVTVDSNRIAKSAWRPLITAARSFKCHVWKHYEYVHASRLRRSTSRTTSYSDLRSRRINVRKVLLIFSVDNLVKCICKEELHLQQILS